MADPLFAPGQVSPTALIKGTSQHIVEATKGILASPVHATDVQLPVSPSAVVFTVIFKLAPGTQAASVVISQHQFQLPLPLTPKSPKLFVGFPSPTPGPAGSLSTHHPTPSAPPAGSVQIQSYAPEAFGELTGVNVAGFQPAPKIG